MRFREAGHFWGIAPGTPASAVRERVTSIDSALREALAQMDSLKTDIIFEQKGRPMFERKQVQRCLEFQEFLKTRFRKDLLLLDPDGPY